MPLMLARFLATFATMLSQAAPLAAGEPITVTEGPAQAEVTASWERGALRKTLRYEFGYKHERNVNIFTISVDGRTHRLVVPEHLVPGLDVGRKRIVPSGLRRQELMVLMDYGPPHQECSDDEGPRDRLIITAAATVSVRLNVYDNCSLRMVDATLLGKIVIDTRAAK